LFLVRDVHEARAFLGQVALALICMAGLWVMERGYDWLFEGHEPIYFGWIRARWFFDAAHVGVLCRFAWRAIIGPRRKRRRSDGKRDGD
jgi:hypothetical protein